MMTAGLVRSAVTLCLAGLICCLPGDRLSSLTHLASPTMPTAAAFGIERLTEMEWQVSRAKLMEQNAVSLLPLLQMLQASLQPSYKSGQLLGYRVRSVERCPMLKELGLRNGDVIRSFNGRPLLQFLMDVKVFGFSFESENTLEVERQSRVIMLHYRFI